MKGSFLLSSLAPLFLATSLCCVPVLSFLMEQRTKSTRFFSSNTNWDENLKELCSIQERQTDLALVEALFDPTALQKIHLLGQARIPVVSNKKGAKGELNYFGAVARPNQGSDIEHSGCVLVGALSLPSPTEAGVVCGSPAAPFQISFAWLENFIGQSRWGAL